MNDIYLKLNIYLHNHHTYKKIISFLEKYLTALFIFIYPCMIIYLIKIKSPLLLITLIKPLSGLITVKCMRKVLNRPRPFEILPLTPAVFHNRGESFPSNHTFSGAIISLMCLPLSLPLSIILFLMTILIGITRILCGLHYISDIIAAFIIAFIIYLI